MIKHPPSHNKPDISAHNAVEIILEKTFLQYSGNPLVRPPHFHQKCGLSSLVEINSFMCRITISSGLSRGSGLSLGV